MYMQQQEYFSIWLKWNKHIGKKFHSPTYMVPKAKINFYYRQTSNTSHTLGGNKIFDHSDVVGASMLALLQLHLHSWRNTWLQCIGQTQLHHLGLGFGASYIRDLMVYNLVDVYRDAIHHYYAT